MTTVKVILKCETQSVMANLKSDSQFMRNIATLGWGVCVGGGVGRETDRQTDKQTETE